MTSGQVKPQTTPKGPATNEKKIDNWALSKIKTVVPLYDM